MFATKVTAKVVRDKSGVATEIPVILTDQGVLGSVTDYVLSLHLRISVNVTERFANT